MPTNYEFKAKTNRLAELEDLLKKEQPLFIGEDYQTDTYFRVTTGRLKLREGTIENSLIHYQRSNIAGAKESQVVLYHHQPNPHLKQVLTASLGIKMVVQKRRRIYFIHNVKFHFDVVEGLGEFVEVEAIDKDGSIGLEQLKKQCDFYIEYFHLLPGDFVAESYSDLLLKS